MNAEKELPKSRKLEGKLALVTGSKRCGKLSRKAPSEGHLPTCGRINVNANTEIASHNYVNR